MTKLQTLIFISSLLLGSGSLAAQVQKDYLIYVLSESADKISLVRFGPTGARVERSFGTGNMPTDIDGPHGLAISPDKKFYYVSFGNGRPFGSVWKYDATNDAVLGRVQLGHFPATMDISPDGEFLYVVNFNLHGDMVPSSVSIVATAPMMEIKRIQTCTMPHGSRLNSKGTRQYSACMMDDMLVEIDTGTLKVSRHFMLTKGKEIGMSGAPRTAPGAAKPRPRRLINTT
jgi:DNA-binding beta-propeller fold protein YncE